MKWHIGAAGRLRLMRYASIYVSLTVLSKKKPQRLLRPLESHTWATAERSSIVDALAIAVGTLPYYLLAQSQGHAAIEEERIQNVFVMAIAHGGVLYVSSRSHPDLR